MAFLISAVDVEKSKWTEPNLVSEIEHRRWALSNRLAVQLLGSFADSNELELVLH